MDLMTLGEQIKQARKAEGMTQTQLGALVDMPKENISRIEKGRQNLSFQTLAKFATALNRKINENILVKA